MQDEREIERRVAALAGHLGRVVLDERHRRRLTLRDLGTMAGVSPSHVRWLEAGHAASFESYIRVGAALGLRAEFDLIDPRRRGTGRVEDPVHATMGEWIAARLARPGVGISFDEPFQHYQFAGRADVLAWSVDERAMLHIENRTRFPNLQDAFGSYNAKRRYLPRILAERLGIRGGFASVSHVMAGLWSSEVLHAVRRHRSSFAAVCPDGLQAFEAWLAGGGMPAGVTSSFVLLDPMESGRRRSYVGSGDLDAVRSRYRGYADAAEALRS